MILSNIQLAFDLYDRSGLLATRGTKVSGRQLKEWGIRDEMSLDAKLRRGRPVEPDEDDGVTISSLFGSVNAGGRIVATGGQRVRYGVLSRWAEQGGFDALQFVRQPGEERKGGYIKPTPKSNAPAPMDMSRIKELLGFNGNTTIYTKGQSDTPKDLDSLLASFGVDIKRTETKIILGVGPSEDRYFALGIGFSEALNNIKDSSGESVYRLASDIVLSLYRLTANTLASPDDKKVRKDFPDNVKLGYFNDDLHIFVPDYYKGDLINMVKYMNNKFENDFGKCVYGFMYRRLTEDGGSRVLSYFHTGEDDYDPLNQDHVRNARRDYEAFKKNGGIDKIRSVCEAYKRGKANDKYSMPLTMVVAYDIQLTPQKKDILDQDILEPIGSPAGAL